MTEDDEEDICSNCNGSGEGMHDGSRCSRCKGSGVVSSKEDDDDGEADYMYDQYEQKQLDDEWENRIAAADCRRKELKENWS